MSSIGRCLLREDRNKAHLYSLVSWPSPHSPHAGGVCLLGRTSDRCCIHPFQRPKRETPIITFHEIFSLRKERIPFRLRSYQLTSIKTIPVRIHSYPLGNIRAFHASPRREIPLFPAVGVIQFGSALAAVTVLSRILISFFPLGTIATFRFINGVKWLAGEKPEVSPESEEFYKMWCEGEKGVRPNTAEALGLVKGVMREDGGLEGPDGRKAYGTPRAPNKFKGRTKGVDAMDPTSEEARERLGENINRLARYTKLTRFYLPDLPPSSIRYYNELSPGQQNEVIALRRYWISLKLFKDGLSTVRWAFGLLVGLPIFLMGVIYLFGLERVPLTGRWRIILLSPEEEDAISASLTGANWYRSVINLLSTPEHPAPPIVPIEDWRWRWVHSVLRRLETAVVAECEGKSVSDYVPRAAYPLHPRPRMSSMLHSALPRGDDSGKDHMSVGPPYSFMLMDKDEKNAFSYGFGGQGASGIVMFTGLLDEIIREQAPTQKPPGILSRLFTTPAPPIPQPSDSQTLHLACIIAHEMGHLLLSHHLETLSQQQVMWPAMLGLAADIMRAFIWPLTIFLGPTVNDALANVGRTSAEELSDRYGQIGFQWKHEYEADLAGLRILALAGFDPDAALDHFEQSVAGLHEAPSGNFDDDSWAGSFFKLWSRATHPSSQQRVAAIRKELARWKEARKID